MNTPATGIMLSDIDFTTQLCTRKARAPDFKSESEALSHLVDTLAARPNHIAQELAVTAMRLTDGDSAGISLEEEVDGMRQFRWIATAGKLESYLNGTVPYHISPCGEVVERDTIMLLHDPARYYGYIKDLDLDVEEVLLVPFHRGGKPAGTVWIVSHRQDKHFDAEDLRLVLSLTKFAAIATQTVGVVNVLRAEDERKDNFLAALSHEMRTPLSAITVATEVLKQLNKDGDPAHHKALECMERQMGQLQALVHDLTDIASIKTGRVTLHTEALILQNIVTKAIDSCHATLREKRQHLTIDMPANEIRLEGDEIKLTQVLVNLLNNAIKYTPPEGGISLKITEQPERVSIKISDTGIGIPAALLPRIFDMFMQVPVSDRPRYSGLGIGLALVYQFVQLHRGSITAYSAGENQGSAFTVELPRL